MNICHRDISPLQKNIWGLFHIASVDNSNFSWIEVLCNLSKQLVSVCGKFNYLNCKNYIKPLFIDLKICGWNANSFCKGCRISEFVAQGKEQWFPKLCPECSNYAGAKNLLPLLDFKEAFESHNSH